MSRTSVDVVDVMERYAAGYFPMVDETGDFFWDRWPVRAVLPVDSGVATRAQRMLRRAQGSHAQTPHFEFRYNTALEPVIAHLRRVKEHSWVQGAVVDIYRALHAAGLLWTIEAWAPGEREHGQTDPRAGRLVGGLVGLVLPGVFVAETMYGLVPEASKVCLCHLVANCWAGGRGGFAMIDVQTPHDRDETGAPLASGTAHPCIRLGERQLELDEFLAAQRAAWNRQFAGSLREWVHLAREEKARRA